MYRHCPSCTRDLGANEALEHFPVGRRLAYDTARGRLWVLCPRCRGWNLAPIEERWEAVEEAERRFEMATHGHSTEHIALGRLADGTELVRIGGAKAPELAGWRYAERISARWKRAQWAGGIGTTAWILVGPSGIGGPLLPLVLAGWAGYGLWDYRSKRGRRIEFREEPPEGSDAAGRGGGRIHQLNRRDLRRLHLLPGHPDAGSDDPADDWRLEFSGWGHGPIRIPRELRNRALRLSTLELNHDIGKPAHVQKALERVVDAGEADRVPGLAVQSLVRGEDWGIRMKLRSSPSTAVRDADPVLRLALEIAANDDAERIALEGELHRLELEWKEAEELAAISDDLLVPAWVRERIAGWKGEGHRGGG